MTQRTPNQTQDMRTADETAQHPNTWYRAFNPDFKISEQPLHTLRPLRILIIGAGAGGLLAAFKAARQLRQVSYVVYEKNDEVGGTWYENRYPGLEIDSPSHTYQWTFHRNPAWSRYQAPGREVWRYLKDWATESDILKDVKLNHRVDSAVWRGEEGLWEIGGRTAGGKPFSDRGEILIAVNGVLSNPKMLDVPGIDNFKGRLVHTGAWPEDLELAGKTVAVIGGAGASGVQLVPSIQPLAQKLIVFLRSKFWGVSGQRSKFVGKTRRNFDYSEEQILAFKEDPQLAARYQRDVEHDLSYIYEGFHRGGQLHERIVSILKHETIKSFGKVEAQKYIPEYGFGCRRSAPSGDFAESLKKDNVEVVQAVVVGFTENGIIDASGTIREVDVAVCATSYSAFMPNFPIMGNEGRDLESQIQTTRKSYLSIMNEGFPNLFYIPSTNAPVNHGSWLPMTEAYMRYTFKVIAHMQRTSIKAISPKKQAVDDYFVWTHELMKRLSMSYPCHSWFKPNGAEHGPVMAVYAGSRAHFYEVLKEPRMEDFEVEYWGNRFTHFGNGFTNAETTTGADDVWYLEELEKDFSAGMEAYDICPIRPRGPPADPDIVIPKAGAKGKL
ncbi:hypothetical protein FOBRF1_006720 [Fusarium oxysporum]